MVTSSSFQALLKSTWPILIRVAGSLPVFVFQSSKLVRIVTGINLEDQMDGGTTELLTALYRNAHPFINYSKFEVGSWEDLYFEERRTTKADILKHIASRRKKMNSSRVKRNSLAGKKGVMYVSLDGGGGESCPSLADSAAVSLSQMAFLSMSVSIFSVGMK